MSSWFNFHLGYLVADWIIAAYCLQLIDLHSIFQFLLISDSTSWFHFNHLLRFVLDFTYSDLFLTSINIICSVSLYYINSSCAKLLIYWSLSAVLPLMSCYCCSDWFICYHNGWYDYVTHDWVVVNICVPTPMCQSWAEPSLCLCGRFLLACSQ